MDESTQGTKATQEADMDPLDYAAAGIGRYRCLTVRQPWATLLVRGVKDVEVRSWPAPADLWEVRHCPPLLIHAASTRPTPAEVCRDWPWAEHLTALSGGQWGDVPRPDECEYGAVLGSVYVQRCTREVSSVWHVDVGGMSAYRHAALRSEGRLEPRVASGGKWGWYVRAGGMLAEPVPLRGRQRVFWAELPVRVF